MTDAHHHHDHGRTTSHGQTQHYWMEDFLARQRMNHVIRCIPKGAVVCDVGCGYRGVFLLRYSDHFSRAYGFDIAVDEDLNSDRVTLRAADVNTAIPLPDNSVDVVTSLAVLEHLTNRKKHLQEVYRILKPGGQLLLTTPTPRNKPLLEFLAFRLHVTDATEIADHKCYLSGNDLRQLLQTAGFLHDNIITKIWQFGLNNSVRATK